MKKSYKLLTPGPLTVTDTVRGAMDFDYCTWDDDYKQVTQSIRQDLLEIAEVDPAEYTTVLLQGSGTYANEAVLSTLTHDDARILFLTNGKYGERLIEMAEYAGIDHLVYDVAYDTIHDADHVDQLLHDNPDITHVMMVHSETTSGLLNPIEPIAKLAHQHDAFFFVDAMSSFGAVPIDMTHIDCLVTSANKCIQGVPGFAIVIVKRDLLEVCKGNSSTLSLDLYAQHEEMERDGKWRYTSPTHVVMAFAQALKEFKERGGVAAQHQRYSENQAILSQGLEALGFKVYVPQAYQGPIITTFLYPDTADWNFNDMYQYAKDRGYVLYPGKLTDIDTFRVGNIGEVYAEDMEQVIQIMKDYQEELQHDN